MSVWMEGGGELMRGAKDTRRVERGDGFSGDRDPGRQGRWCALPHVLDWEDRLVSMGHVSHSAQLGEQSVILC